MSKSRKKRKKKKQKTPRFSAKVTLSPRLTALLHSADLPQQAQGPFFAALDELVAGVDAPLFLRSLLAVRLKAPVQNRVYLAQHLPEWINARSHLPTLKKFVVGQALTSEQEELALTWLQAAGVDTQALLSERPDLLYEAHLVEDDYQAALILLCYTNPRRNRVHGFTFLLDYNPPWDGAVKDVINLPQRTPEKAYQEFVADWESRGPVPPEPIDGSAAKARIIKALQCNRESGVRLPRDLIAVRDKFDRIVVPLPDAPDQPAFTMADFDELAQSGEEAEAIMHFEQTVGRRIRLEDGQEVLVMGDPLDRDDDEWDE